MRISPQIQHDASVVLLCFVAVIAVALVGSSIAQADEPCKGRADIQNLSDIKQNQSIVAENREPHDRIAQAVQSDSPINPDDVEGYNTFTEAKGWNAAEVAALAANGCSIDWSTMTLIPFE